MSLADAQTDWVIVSEPSPGVRHVALNRPQAHNALNQAMMGALVSLLTAWQTDDAVRVVVLSGGTSKAFAAGADIKELANLTVSNALKTDPLSWWDMVARFAKPILSAVHGVALGGGFELALATDIIFAADNARFGLPELALGVIPGAGGTQRITRLLGKHRALALMLTGDPLSAEDACKLGIVHQVLTSEAVLPAALALADTIAQKPMLAVIAAKKTILAAQNQPLDNGIQMERQAFYQLFATADKHEGMSAFIEKRPAQFTHQ